jgi:hypothetical protein
VKEFYLGVGGGERKSFKDVKSYKRRKRWLASPLWRCAPSPSGGRTRVAGQASSAGALALRRDCSKRFTLNFIAACAYAISAEAFFIQNHLTRNPGMSTFYDALETRSPAEREAALMAALPQQIAHAQKASARVCQHSGGGGCWCVTSREALARCPSRASTSCWSASRRAARTNVFGGFSALGFGPGMPRVFASPGTIYEPEGTRPDYWRMARAIYAAGFRPGELIHNSFSYHFVPAGSMMETGAHALGCTCSPAARARPSSRCRPWPS